MSFRAAIEASEREDPQTHARALTLGHLGVAFRDEWQSLLIYQHLGALSRQRMVNMLRELLTWAVGRRQWRK